MHPLRYLRVLGFAFVLLVPVFAQTAGAQVLYGVVSGNDELVTIDVATGAATPVGPLGLDIGSSGLAFSGDGVLWGMFRTANPAADALYTIDTATGTATEVVAMDRIVSGRGIEFGPDGHTLYYTDGTTDSLYTVDTSTGISTRIAPLDQPAADFASSPAGVYYMTKNVGGVRSLVTVDLTTGVLTTVGPLGVATNGSALAYHPGLDRLFAVQSGGLVSIDPATGQGSLVGPLGVPTSIGGLAVSPAPIPAVPATWGRIKQLYRP